MGITFTSEQQQVIDLRNRNILVSAAAGSGKTAVLVERIITRLTKDQPPLNVDQLLITTFTEAAAAEMKERIHAAIEKALEANPDNLHLQRQATLIHQAQITTIHKFCLSVIREHFHAIDLEPGFRVGEEGELKLLQQDVVRDVIERAYQDATPEFLSFVECFSTGKDDANLEALILQLYEYSRSYPKPDAWLDLCASQYDICSGNDLEHKQYVQELLDEVHDCLREIRELLCYGIEVCDAEDGPAVYKKTLLADLETIDPLLAADTFQDMYQVASKLKFVTLATNRDVTVDERKIQYVQGIRKEVKSYVEHLKKDFFYDEPTVLAADMVFMHEKIKMLIQLVKCFAEQFTIEKRAKNLIDFSDMEQYALQILTKEEDGHLVSSDVAETYQHRFAEIMIDEYQDSNYVQEAIMTSVSGVSKGNYNIFMVGDVKQSIYRFRLSRPELFMEKFRAYSTTDGEERRIDLHKNFRSRREVLDSTNFIFHQIMIPRFGGIEYDEKAALHVGANYDDRAGNETEVLLIEMPKSKAQERIELEAEVIGTRIKELMESHTILDKHTGEYRPLRYSDIVILTRTAKGFTEVFSKVLEQVGIPTYACSKEGYFETQEIRVVLNYLQILDNPRQDIPFTSVLVSMFGGITEEELAYIRSGCDAKTMYDCVQQYRRHGESEELKERLCAFLSMYESFRNQVPYTAIHVLLWNILEKTGYRDYIAAFPGGEQRTANLEMLIEKAIAFEGTSYKGLFNFVRYIEQLEKYDIDYGEANLMNEHHDVVSIMTIHKSKGLEFPIVFVAGMSKKFNLRDTTSSLVVHSELGVGAEAIDPVMRTKAPTFIRKIIQLKVLRESVAEQLRVLYVAMTRAKEKLIMTAVVSELEAELQKCSYLRGHKETPLSYYHLVRADKYLDWVLPALYRNQCMETILEKHQLSIPFQHPLFRVELPVIVRNVTIDELAEKELCEQLADDITRESLLAWDTCRVYDEDMRKKLEEQLSYEYPYKAYRSIKQKLSVSELKKREYMDEDGEVTYKDEEIIPLLPKFLQEKEALTGASKGTAYHKLLEILDLAKEYDEANLIHAISQFVAEGFLTEEMAECIRPQEILGFLNSPIGKRVRIASQNEVYHAEQPFVIGIDAKRVYPQADTQELVLVQGIVDVYFEEDGELVILDYKTDKVQCESELAERYHAQLNYYAEAIGNLTGQKVKEKVIYSFALQKEIYIE